MTTINIEQLNTITENLKIQDAVRPLTTAEITKHWEVYRFKRFIPHLKHGVVGGG